MHHRGREEHGHHDAQLDRDERTERAKQVRRRQVPAESRARHHHRVAHRRHQKTQLQHQQQQHRHLLRVAQHGDQRRGDDRHDDKNHLERVQHPGAQGHQQQHAGRCEQGRQRRRRQHRQYPAVGAKQPEDEAENGGAHQQGHQGAAEVEGVGEQFAPIGPAQCARQQGRQHQQHAAGGGGFHGEQLAAENARQQGQDHAARHDRHRVLRARYRGDVGLQVPALPARQQRPQQQDAQARQERGVEHILRADDARGAERRARQAAGLGVGPHHGVAQQDQHQRGWHDDADGGGRAGQRGGAAGVKMRQARRHQARDQARARGHRAVHGRDQGAHPQGGQRMRAAQRPEPARHDRKQGIGQAHALQQHSDKHVQRQGLQQVVLQQAHQAHRHR